MANPWEKYSKQKASQVQGASQSDDSGDGPWAKYSKPEPEKKPERTGAGMAALEHFGNSASLGYLPQLQAAASRLTPDPNRDVNEKLKARGFKIQEDAPSYVKERDANIRRLELESEEHPYASGAGSVGGAVTSGIAASGATAVNAASKAGRLLQAAKGGALLGAVANPGDTEGKVAEDLQLKERLNNAAFGAALGGAGQGAVEGASTLAKSALNVPSKMINKAEERAFKSAGAMLKDYRKVAGQGRVNELGRYMLDNGLVKPGMTVEDIAKAAETLKGEHGQTIGNILNKLDDIGAAAPTHDELAQIIEKQALPMKGLNTSRPSYNALQDLAADIRTLGQEPAIQVSKGEVGSLTGKGTEYLTDPKTGEVMAKFRHGKLISEGPTPVSSEMAGAKTAITPAGVAEQGVSGTFQDAQDIKKFISDQVEATGGWNSLNPTEKNKALRQSYKIISDKIEQGAGSAAQNSGDETLIKDYLKAKSGYRNSAEVAQIAKDKALRENANRFFSPSDYLTAGTGAIAGAGQGEGLEGKIKGAAAGAALGLVNKAGRTYGTPIVSQVLNKTGQALARSPVGALGELSAPVLSALEKSPTSTANVARTLSAPNLKTTLERGVASSPEDRWAQRGAENLGLSETQMTMLMDSKQGRRFLIEASGVKPNSAEMKLLKKQIQKKSGG